LYAIGAAAYLLSPPASAPAYDLSFDYTSFEATFGQAQFDVLNYPGMNGRYMNTSTDNHRGEMVANGNELAQFYNWLTDRYAEQAVKNGAAAADVIHQYTMNNSYNEAFDPPRPEWLVLNEISSSLWSANPGAPSLSTYRTWLIDCVTRLHEHYGYNVVTLAPFQNPGQNNASWQALSEVSYIGIECYLSGTEVWNSGATNAQRLAWATGQYQASKNSYLNRGVPEDRLFVTEHFANNNTTFINSQGQEQAVFWGRAGLASAADWDTVIQLRQDAILAVGFDGFLAYNWGGNGMGVTQAEQIQHEYYYRTRRVLASQQPQWLSDSAINVNGTVIPLSWSQPLNWLGGVPDAAGAVANFWRTNTASRTITLDGTKTVGTLSFTSAQSFTISPGSGGTLIMQNSSGPAVLTSDEGSHNLGVNVHLTNGLAAEISAGTLTVSGVLSGLGTVAKSGAGTLSWNTAINFSGDMQVLAGTMRINSLMLNNSSDVYLSSGATLNLNITSVPDTIDSLFIDGSLQAAGTWGAAGSGAQYTSALITGPGRLQVTNGYLVGDYNDDGTVDAGDYLVWRMSAGGTSLLNRHPNISGVIGAADYDAWRTNFGQSGGGGSGAAVPEPSALALIVIGVLFAQSRRDDRK
jgi:autotransporter-associated beta strand protein